jgi:hypothetical protein
MMLSCCRLLAVLSVMELVAPLSSKAALAQAPTAASPQIGTLTVFLDCDDCDDDYVRTEIAYVNWVRDRTVADVHVLVTAQDAGGGGEQFTFAFIGQRSLAERGDTLTFTTNANTTDDEEREGLTRTLALGLVQFVARSSGASSLRITSRRMALDAPGMQTMPSRDRWRAWVFEISLGSDLSGEQNYRNREFDAELNANRTTAEWKTVLETNWDYSSERAIDVDSIDNLGRVIVADTTHDLQRSWGAELLVVKSINGHMSTGFRAAMGSSTFRNQQLRTEFMPAFEYNVFDYSEATRRRLVFQFGAGVDAFAYHDTTVFDKLREAFPTYLTAVNYATQQPWGQSGIQLEHRGYLNDPAKRSTELSGHMNVRLFRGFGVRFGGGYSWIHDQVYLRKGNPDQADVLLRRTALLTSYEYNMFFGISYTFGSIFNNVVNPRFF